MHHIDAHVHVWTPDTDHYPLAAGFKKEDMKPASFTPEQLSKHCRPSGVERVVLIQMSFYRFDNSYMLDIMKLHREEAGEQGRGVVRRLAQVLDIRRPGVGIVRSVPDGAIQRA